MAMFIETLGYEVIAAPTADICPHYHAEFQNCSQDNACGDAILIGQELPLLQGIEFIERRLKGGCKGASANNAIVCRPWSSSEKLRAESLGCRFFETPLRLSEVANWLAEVESNTSADRQLANLPV